MPNIRGLRAHALRSLSSVARHAPSSVGGYRFLLSRLRQLTNLEEESGGIYDDSDPKGQARGSSLSGPVKVEYPSATLSQGVYASFVPGQY
jgi:hypothetical protein